MKQKILITGIAGSGKSTLSATLRGLGHEAYDIEDIDGMFAMYRKDTGAPYDDFVNADPEKIKNSQWLCAVSKLKELLSSQKKEVAFYCGVASNMDEVIPFFNKVLLLKADPTVLHGRLSRREGTDDMGNAEEGRQVVLGWKDWWENEMLEKGAVLVSADGKPDAIAKNILKISRAP